MLGLKSGTVKLCEHNNEWSKLAGDTIEELYKILGDIAIDIQHIGSTSINKVHAKPIIDIAIAVKKLDDIKKYITPLKEKDIIFRNQDVLGQLLFVKGDFKKNTRTHHIHVVEWNKSAWINYINFRDYLNANDDKAEEYDILKQHLAEKYPNDRIKYTNEKQELINRLLEEAKVWRSNNLKSELLKNIEKIHTTDMGKLRIKNNLNLETENVVGWCKEKIKNSASCIERRGKNYYVFVQNNILTINAFSYTIITAHKQSLIKKQY